MLVFAFYKSFIDIVSKFIHLKNAIYKIISVTFLSHLCYIFLSHFVLHFRETQLRKVKRKKVSMFFEMCQKFLETIFFFNTSKIHFHKLNEIFLIRIFTVIRDTILGTLCTTFWVDIWYFSFFYFMISQYSSLQG